MRLECGALCIRGQRIKTFLKKQMRAADKKRNFFLMGFEILVCI